MQNRRVFLLLVTILAGIGLLFGPYRQLPPQTALVQKETAALKIDAYIEEQMRDLGIPGMAVAIVRGDQIEYARGYGVADDNDRPVTAQTPFLIASLSKSFTALGIMQLVEEGNLRLDDPVQKYLPWLELADPAASPQLTIRRLLYHSSGFSELGGYLRNLDNNEADNALEASFLDLGSTKLNALPGERFEYSNTNYDLLGLLIQNASGEPYEVFIKERIFSPLKMEKSFTSLEEARANGSSSGYHNIFGLTVRYDALMPYSRTVIPSAGLFSSAEDMGRYLLAYLNQGRSSDGAAILSREGFQELHTPGINIGQDVQYAMGWTIFPFTEAAASSPAAPIPTGVSHGGEWVGFRSVMLLIPEQDLGVVVLINKSDWRNNNAYNNIGWNTALIALGLEQVEFPSNRDFMTRYGLVIGGIVILLLLISLGWSARYLLRRSGRPSTHRWQVMIFLVLMPLIDLALAGYVLLVELESPASLRLELAFSPETGLLYLLILVLTLGWGTLRTILAIQRLFTSNAGSASPTADNWPNSATSN